MICRENELICRVDKNKLANVDDESVFRRGER